MSSGTPAKAHHANPKIRPVIRAHKNTCCMWQSDPLPIESAFAKPPLSTKLKVRKICTVARSWQLWIWKCARDVHKYEKVCTRCARSSPGYVVWWLQWGWVWTSVSWCHPCSHPLAMILQGVFGDFYSFFLDERTGKVESMWSGWPWKNNDLLLSVCG